MTRLIAIAVAVCLAGCSFVMRENPNDWSPAHLPKCSDSELAPTLDAWGASLGVGVGLPALVLSPLCEENASSCAGTGLLFLAAGVVYAVAWATGRKRIKRCWRARCEHEQWQHRYPGQPGPAR